MKKLFLFIGVALLSACAEAKRVQRVEMLVDTSYTVSTADGYVMIIRSRPTPKVGDVLTTLWRERF